MQSEENFRVGATFAIRGDDTVATTSGRIVAPPASAMRPRIRYDDKIFPRKAVYCLSFIHISMALLLILTQTLLFYDQDAGKSSMMGFWCFLFFGTSGIFGIRAAVKASDSTVIIFMILSMFSVCHAFWLLITSATELIYHRQNHLRLAMFLVRTAIGVIEAEVAVASAVIACKASCCKPKEEVAMVYTVNVGANASQNVSHQISAQELPNGITPLPTNQLQVAERAAALEINIRPDVPFLAYSEASAPPPSYETATGTKP